ncbi:unnamed protein product [Chironomus riparius]|uniref:Uncharacterized protein n=1 Tax=Chironomus riparius TaxID=315576 RepID=A0A9N9RPV4_9DIPT|nr:unnamed protein product [Chironomus riparius]
MKQILFLIIISTTCILIQGNDLNKDGIWVEWNISKSGVPENAVIGGHDFTGDLYVIRANHNHVDGYRGKIAGKYSPNGKYASVPYHHKEHPKHDFEILTHTNYIWKSNTNQTENLIPGGYVFQYTQYICRGIVDDDWIPGKLAHFGYCYVSYDGKEIPFDSEPPYYHSWEVLERNNKTL